MGVFRKSIPSEFTDEDRWRIGPVSLSRKTFIVVLLGLAFTYSLYKLLGGMGYPKLGVIIGLFITIVIAFLTTLKVPESDYLKGGGITYMIMIKRLFIRSRKKVVYIRGYERDRKKYFT